MFRDTLGGVGTIKMRGPDGKTVTLSFRGQKDLMKQLERLEKNGELDPKMAARMKRAMGLAQTAPGKGQKELEQKLKKPITFDFIQTPLTDVLAFMRANCPVNQVVDPALAKTNPKITWRVAKISCGNAFEWLSRLAKTEFVVANETLCFGGADFVDKFKAITPLDSDNAGISAGLKRRVSFDFIDTPLKDTVAFLTRLLKVNVVVLGDGGRKETISLRLDTAPAGLVFEYIGLLLGRDVAVEKEAVRFAEPAGAEPQGAPAP